LTVSCLPKGIQTCPNFNYELLVDGIELKEFTSFNLTQTLNGLAGFSFDVGNPNGTRTNRIQGNSEIEFKASWGNRSLKQMILGIVKDRGFQTGTRRDISISGTDFGDYLTRKRPWDVNYDPIPFNNESSATIISRLVSLVSELNLRMNRKKIDPKFSILTDPTQNVVLDELKSIIEYAGYEWVINGRTVDVREPNSLDSNSSKYNLIFGSPDSYTTLPDLPNVILLSSDLDENFTNIRNKYKVDGVTGIHAIADDQQSIQRYRGTFEGYYKDEGLTSVQSCYQVARELSRINGYPKINITCAFRGNIDLKVGDVVYVGDNGGTFSMLDNQYLRVVSVNHSFGSRWMTSVQLGSLQKTLVDLI